MRLFEFADDDPLRVKLLAVANQLKNQVLGSGRTWSTDEFLNFLKQNDIVVDKADLFDMVKKEPLVNIISNINKDQVVFRGQENASDVPQKDDEMQKTRQQMASKALK
jgi:hypothetical protein